MTKYSAYRAFVMSSETRHLVLRFTSFGYHNHTHMKQIYFLVFISVLSFHLSAQQCSNCRYISPIFDSVKVSTVHFGEGVKADGDTQQLYADIYEPYGDTVMNRPVFIFAFGGGFITGERDDWYVIEVCKYFASTGYVAMAIDYRYGIEVGEIISLQHMRIFFRPMQDMRASVQYMKADYSELGNNYHIDTSRIVIGGASSGGITALMTAHCDDSTEMAEMGNMSALNALGGFYSTSGFYPNYSWSSIATVNVSGALINADWIEPGDNPIISAHGDTDNVVPYKYGGFAGLQGFFDLQGSYVVDSIAKLRGVCSYLYTMEGQGHPTEEMGIEYIKSVVDRMALRVYSSIHGKSFCCPLSADVTPGDTLFYGPNAPTSTLNAVVTNDSGSATLLWCSIAAQYCDAGVSSINVQPDSNLKYVALIADEGGCQAADLYIVQDSTIHPNAIGEVAALIDLSLFPQPASDILHVRASADALKGLHDCTLTLYNTLGEVVTMKKIAVSNGEIAAAIEVGGLAAGNYLMSLQSEGRTLARKSVSIMSH